VRFLRETAEAEKIPYQLRQPGGGGTDSGAIQRSLSGIPTVSVSVPHRYTHSPISLARVEDWKNTINLLRAALKRIAPQLLVIR
jgi:endoglucanase